MKWISLLLVSVGVVFVASLRNEEIEKLRKQLDAELLKLEAAKDLKAAAEKRAELDFSDTVDETKKTASEIENLLSAAIEDHLARNKKKAAQEDINKIAMACNESLDELLLDVVLKEKTEKEKREKTDSGYDAAIDRLLKYFKKDKAPGDADSEKVTKDASAEDTKVLDELLEAYVKDEKKASADEAYEELLLSKKEVSLDDEAKRKKESCRDERPDCERLKGFCKEHKGMKEACARTCGICTPCEDLKPRHRCLTWKKHNLCDADRTEKLLKKYCYDTCGYCRTASPPACMMSPYGCCWDKVTMRTRDGVCHAKCQDDPNMKRLCKTFIDDCKMVKLDKGKWMRRNCPVTCGVCDPELEEKKSKCVNHPNFSEQCQEWKKSGECETDHVVKTALCKYTCGTCDPDKMASTPGVESNVAR